MKKIYKPGEARVTAKAEDDQYLPDKLSRNDLGSVFEDFVDEHLYDTRQFLKFFGDKRASIPIPVPSLLDLVKNSVCYDAENQFDLRLLLMTVAPIDRPLLIDLIKQLSERFINNPMKPKSPLTLAQFKVLLAYRMNQLGF